MTRVDKMGRPRWRVHACVDRRQSSHWIGGRSCWGRGQEDHRGGGEWGSTHKWANGTARCSKTKTPLLPFSGSQSARAPRGGGVQNSEGPTRERDVSCSVSRCKGIPFSRPHSPRRRLLTCPLPPAFLIGRCREVGVCQGEQAVPAVPCKMSVLPLPLF